MRSSIRFERNEIVSIREKDTGVTLWTVVQSHPEGWLLEPLDGSGERRLFRHIDIFRSYIEGRLKRLGRPARTLSPEEELRVRRAWDGAPAWARVIAERRYIILRACREKRREFTSMAKCFSTVPALIVAKHGPAWAEEDRKLRPASTAIDPAVEPRVPESGSDAGADECSPYHVPGERTLWRWHGLCGGVEPDLRVLLPRWHLRGDSRPLFDATLVDLMDQVIRDELLKTPPKAVVFAYGIFELQAKKLVGVTAPPCFGSDGLPDGTITVPCGREDAVPEGAATGTADAEDAGGSSDASDAVLDVHVDVTATATATATEDEEGGEAKRCIVRARMNDVPSYSTFYRRYRNEVRKDEKTRAQSGHRQVRLDFGTFAESEAPPFYMNQVEADHSFINMNVKDDFSGRLLGRPWVTAVRERTTKVILGLHVSFLPPSWMTLSRAIAHAIWPKDLSGHPGLKNDWFCHGVFDWMLADRGLDFLCDGLRSTGRILGFEVGNLAGFSPWLKGGLERWFRRMKLQVFSYREGTSAWRALKHYDGRAKASMTLSGLKAELVKWVVDEYHFKEHGALGMTPADRWGMEVVGFGPPNGVNDFDDLRRLFCRPESRGIGTNGIEYDGLLYNSPYLTHLRGRASDVSTWDIMIDPFDLRSVFLIDLQAGVTEDTWIEIPCTRPELSLNVTQHQHEYHKLLARLTAPGEKLTEAMLLRAKEAAERQLEREAAGRPKTGTAARLARYRDHGSFLTPVRIGALPPALQVRPTVDWGEKLFDPVTGAAVGSAAATPSAGTPATDQGRDQARTPSVENEAGSDGREMEQASSGTGGSDADYESLVLKAMEDMSL